VVVCFAVAILDRRYALSFTVKIPNVIREIMVIPETIISVLWSINRDTI
jgi:hypothetical protein